MMKICYHVEIADSFTDVPMGIASWPVANGDILIEFLHIEFEQKEAGKVMQEADQALAAYIVEHYPGKDYRIYYWWWE